MSYWFCKNHGKSIYISACVHLKQNVESLRGEDFNLILEELSQVDKSYLGTLLCNDCSRKIGVDGRSAIFFDPQLRRFEKSSCVEEKQIEYKKIFDELDDKLVSICHKCLLNVYPEYDSIIKQLKESAVEIEKKQT